MFGFFFSALKKVYVLLRKVLGNRHQSLPSTNQDLKNHKAFPFSRINSSKSIPSAQTATTTIPQDYCTVDRFPQISNTPSVYNQPKQTLPKTSSVIVNPIKAPDIPAATRTNVFPKSTSSSSYVQLPPPPSAKLVSSSSFPFGAIPGSPKSPSVTNKPILARALSNPTSNETKSQYNNILQSPKLASSISSSSSSPFSAIPGSSKSPSVTNKPILARAVSNRTSNETKIQYNVVEKGSTPLYEIPEDIKDLIRKDIVPGVLRKPLSSQTYKDYFATLLYAEDYYLEKWDGFEMENVTLKLSKAEIFGRKDKSKNKNDDKKDEKIFVEFEVDSIAEKRPFLLSRDFASVRPTGRKVDPFQGIIFRVVRSNIVLVEFGEDFHAQHYSSCKYDVKFSFNRICLKRAHEAIAAASDMLFTEFLFPDGRPKSSYISDNKFFMEKIPFNPHKFHSAAISRIMNLNGAPAYLLEGPLSMKYKQLTVTGMVVRDAVVQLCQASSQNRILLCAPTNIGCDVFMRSLRKEVGDSNIFRANAAFRELDDVPIDIRPFCPYKEKEEIFTCPSLSQLLKFKVILSTYMSSFRLHNEGIGGGHFTHIILVDASSVIEPEILVPMTKLTSVSTNVVVTGDPRNCSSWIRSDIARNNGLRTSYFKRLRERKLYRDLDPESITQLKDDPSSSSSYFRILLCAPTNIGCDVFMRSLWKEVGDSNIFRANAAFRELDGVPIDILPFCPYKKKEKVFTCPSLSQLLKFRVILSTFMSSFRLRNEGIGGEHFTHIILVDASSVIEPEILVPLTNLTSVSTNVVVTGARGNWSVWIRSDIARNNGLRTSYFERLRERKLYRKSNPESITLLEDDSSSSSSYFR